MKKLAVFTVMLLFIAGFAYAKDYEINKKAGEYDPHFKAIVEMAKRRPVTAADIAGVLNITPEESEAILKGLLLKGAIKKQEHEREVFYTAQQK